MNNLKDLNFQKAFTTNLQNKGASKLNQYFYKRIDPSKLKI